MANSLKHNGYILIDFFNSDKIKNNGNQQEIKKVDGITFKINKKIYNNTAIKEIKVIDNNQEYLYEERVKLLPKIFFENTLSKNDICIEKIWGDYDLSEYNPEISNRMILLGKKLSKKNL